MSDTPRAWRRWSPGAVRHDVALFVVCRGRRLLAAGTGPRAQLTLTYRLTVTEGPGTGQWSDYVLDGNRFRPDVGCLSGVAGPTRRLECPNHAEGHTVSGAKLRACIERLSRHAGAPARVDVSELLV